MLSAAVAAIGVALIVQGAARRPRGQRHEAAARRAVRRAPDIGAPAVGCSRGRGPRRASRGLRAAAHARGTASPSSNLRLWAPCGRNVRPDRGRRPRRLGAGEGDPRGGTRSLGARHRPALPRAAGRRPDEDLGGSRRPVHGRDGARDRRADPGGDRAGRRVHRLHRRRQHQPRDRPDRPAALRRREGDRARDGPGAGGLVRRPGAADDLPHQAGDRGVRTARWRRRRRSACTRSSRAPARWGGTSPGS